MPAQGAAGQAEAAARSRASPTSVSSQTRPGACSNRPRRSRMASTTLRRGGLIRITRREWGRRSGVSRRSSGGVDAGRQDPHRLARGRGTERLQRLLPAFRRARRSRSAGRSTWSRATRRTTRSSTVRAGHEDGRGESGLRRAAAGADRARARRGRAGRRLFPSRRLPDRSMRSLEGILRDFGFEEGRGGSTRPCIPSRPGSAARTSG